jgi:SAM-dependent methyltransferase
MSVFIGPSIWRDMNVVTSTRLMVAMSNAPNGERVIWAPLWNDALIGRSRSLMCTEFLGSDADVMVIIDDDIVFDPPDLWKIVEGCRESRGIYGAVYVTRSTTPHVSSRLWPNTDVTWAAGPVRRPLELQYLATGFFALHRDVLEAMIDQRFDDADGSHLMAECALGADRPFYPFFSPFCTYEDDDRRHYLSEDWAFCNRARQVGARIEFDQSIILEHLGVYPYTVADLERPGAAFPMRRNIERMEYTSEPPVLGEALVDGLLDDLVAWTGDDPGDVRRMVAAGAETTSTLFRVKPRYQSELDWYRRDDVGYAYTAELTGWHMLGGGAWPDGIEFGAGERVLDFGGGIGTWSLVAATRHPITVDIAEPNAIMREFGTWRAATHAIDNVRLLDTSALRDRYDTIVAWHVFEHVPDPEAVLADLLKVRLVPGGRLITDSGFGDERPAQHHQHTDWSGALRAAGLYHEGGAVWRRRADVPVDREAVAVPA